MKWKWILFCIIYFFTVPIFAQTFSVYLIGDAGTYNKKKKKENLDQLCTALQKDQKNSAVIFLGDNVYYNGLKSPNKKRLTKKLDTQVQVLENYKGFGFFIPGNHDWDHEKENGLKYLIQEKEYIDSFYFSQPGKINLLQNSNQIFQPKPGTPGPTTFQLPAAAQIVFIDSQWFLHQYEKLCSSEICDSASELSTIEIFKFQLDSIFKSAVKLNQKQIILCVHHPIYTLGSHSKKDSTKAGTGDISNSENGAMRKIFVEIMHRYKNDIQIFYTSGHEHLLEYFNQMETEKIHYIVSGNSGQIRNKQKTSGDRFGISDTYVFEKAVGYFRIDFYENDTYTIFAIFRKQGCKDYSEIKVFP